MNVYSLVSFSFIVVYLQLIGAFWENFTIFNEEKER